MIAEIDIQCTANSETQGYKSMMKTIRYSFYSVIALLFSLVTACSSTTDPSEAYKGETANQIFAGGEAALRDKDYAEAIKRFEALDVQYPFGRNTETAQLHIIYAYYKNSDYLSAETAADRFIHAHPTSQNVDYAYYMRGLSNYYQNMGIFERLFAVDYSTRDLTQVKKSFNDFAKLEQQFPRSPYAPAAHQYMVYLRNVLANHQVEVAQYYFDHQAYVASANRASIVVENYQGSPVVPDALVMMAKSYHQLRQTALEEQTIQVIRYNYPNTRYVTEVSDKRIADTHFAVTTKKEKALPSETAPSSPPPTPVVSAQAYSKMFPGNGARGATRPVGEMVKDMKSSDFFKIHPSQNSQRAANISQPGMRQQPSSHVAPAAPVEQTQTSAANRSSGSMTTLGSLWDKVANSKLFSTHDKSAPVQRAEAAEPAKTAPEAAPTRMTEVSAPRVEQAGSSATQLAENNVPDSQPQQVVDLRPAANDFSNFPGNGSRR
jgi:outer membrane protein assembly factor BamD